MYHVSKIRLYIGKEIYKDQEIKWFLVMIHGAIGVAWECELDGANYGDWLNIVDSIKQDLRHLHFSRNLWNSIFGGDVRTKGLDGVYEVIDYGGYKGLLRNQAQWSIDKILNFN